MKYSNITKGIFLERLHRFGALVDMVGSVEYVHVKNTGRCKEILIPGAVVFLEKANNPERKTKYSLIAVYKGEMLINIDSQVPNAVVYDALKEGLVTGFPKMNYIKREVTYGNSRFDIYYETVSGAGGFIEIKGVTLDVNGIALFPDAPTARGRKHLIELTAAKKEGYEAHIIFLIQYRPAVVFKPNELMDPEFTKALKTACGTGVTAAAWDSYVTEDEIVIGSSVPIDLG